MADQRLEETEKRLTKVTRVEVTDENGRAYGKYNVAEIQLHLQDDERTLKIFLSPDRRRIASSEETSVN